MMFKWNLMIGRIALFLASGMKGSCLRSVLRYPACVLQTNTWTLVSLRVWHKEICNPTHPVSWPTSFKPQERISCSRSLNQRVATSEIASICGLYPGQCQRQVPVRGKWFTQVLKNENRQINLLENVLLENFLSDYLNTINSGIAK